jgi:hypothetical protein
MIMNNNAIRKRPTCIDLQKLFGREYRIVRDPAYFADYGTNAHRHDPWYCCVSCKHGHIFPYGGLNLGASTDRRGAIANRLRRIPGVRVVQDGSDGVTVVFPIELFDAVAVHMKPRKRRRLTPEQRKKFVTSGIDALTRYRNCRDTIEGPRDAPMSDCTYQVAG